MLEFDREKFKSLAKGTYKYSEIADILTNSYGINTTENTIKAWMRNKNPNVPEYERIAALSDLFGVPSLHLFTDGEKELEKNIKKELQLNPEKYRKYFEKEVRSDTYQDILDELDNMTNEQLSALRTLITGVLKK